MKKQKNTLIIILSLIIILLIIAITYTLNAKNNYKVVINKSLEHLISYKHYFKKSFELQNKQNTIIKGDVNFEFNDDFLGTEINPISFEYSLLRNKEDFKIEANFLRDKQVKLQLESIIKDYNGYVLLKDIYSKYIDFGRIYIDDENPTAEDYRYFAERSYTLFLENITEEYIKYENQKIKINDKNINAQATIVTLKEIDLVNIYNSVIDGLRTDAKIKKMIKKLEKVDTEDVGNSKLVFTMYTKKLKGELLGFDLNLHTIEDDYEAWTEKNCAYNDDACWDEMPTKEVENKLEYRLNEKPTFTITNDNKELGVLTIEEKGNITTFTFSKDKDTYGNLIITRDNLNYTIALNTISGEDSLELILNTNIEEIQKSKDYKVLNTINFKFKSYNDIYKGKININYNIKETDEEIEKPLKTIDYEDIPYEEQEKIYEKLMNVFYEISGTEKPSFDENTYTNDYELNNNYSN